MSAICQNIGISGVDKMKSHHFGGKARPFHAREAVNFSHSKSLKINNPTTTTLSSIPELSCNVNEYFSKSSQLVAVFFTTSSMSNKDLLRFLSKPAK